MTDKNTQDLIAVLEEHIHRLKDGQKLTSALVVVNYDESETTERVSMAMIGDSDHIEGQILEVAKGFNEAAIDNHLKSCADPECGIGKETPIGFLTIVAKLVAHVAANYPKQFGHFTEYLQEGLEKCEELVKIRTEMDALLGDSVSEMTPEELANLPEGLKNIEPGKFKMIKIDPDNIDKVLEALANLAKLAKSKQDEEEFTDPGKPVVPNPSDRKN